MSDADVPLLAAGVSRGEIQSLLSGAHSQPHRILGPHDVVRRRERGVCIRAFHPDAVGVRFVLEGGHAVEAQPAGRGLFEAFLPGLALPVRYRTSFRFADGQTWDRDDPYRFAPTVGELDLHLLGEGTHRRMWEALGARVRTHDGVLGTAFAVWAPNAVGASVAGDFCGWDVRLLPMRSLGGSGIFELFVPGVGSGALYKYAIRTRSGELRWKSDPLGAAMELPPGTSSRVFRSEHRWSDGEWMAERARRDPVREPMSVYEVHLGSWARVPEQGNRSLTYREIAPRLVDHAKRLGFTHVELLPVAEHPFSGSWGYQVTGYYAPTARHGSPDDFRFFVDHCHRNGVGVLVDWVPAHFPKDDFALRQFDGTALYEHEDPRLGEHPDWGTLIFNYGRSEVRNFLIANALYWLEEFHVDGLRVDAVASMLYLDYSRPAGSWVPNVHGGNENLEAIGFLRTLNEIVEREHPGCVMIAEESTSWPGVTRRTSEGGLGFTFKWNMGWMHDTLHFLARDPVHRRWHVNDLTFAMLYEQHERFLMPLSHDEVVHGKGSLLSKMQGDEWQKLANLRLLFAYQWTRPGKELLFMGSELAPWSEWNHDASLDWHLAADPKRAGLLLFLEDLGRLQRERPCLWRWDHDSSGFEWIDCSDHRNTVISYLRWDGDAHLVIVLNLTPTPHEGYRIGVPTSASYEEVLSSDATRYGGSGMFPRFAAPAERVPWHGRPASLRLSLPPLGALVLAPVP